VSFPIFKTKIEGINQKFDLINPQEIEAYFKLKAGKEIEKIRDYLNRGDTFVAYLLGKKNSGKGTYAKMFAQIVSPEKIEHFSIGDMVRKIDEELREPQKREELVRFLEKNYRGRFSLNEIISSLENRNTQVLLPTELILSLIKRELTEKERKAIFIDGFPRDLDQISYSLFFRDLIGYRDDPDFFVLIDIPNKVIDERIKGRRVCPLCQTSRNLFLFPTTKIGFDERKKEFYLICDNPNCQEVPLERKEGDELGIEPIKERLEMDEKLIKMAFSLHGVPKILLRNTVPKKEAENFIEEYEVTPRYSFEWDEKEKKVIRKEEPWLVFDDENQESFSLLAPPVVLSLIKQIVEVLDL
jgi:adenylate kinase